MTGKTSCEGRAEEGGCSLEITKENKTDKCAAMPTFDKAFRPVGSERVTEKITFSFLVESESDTDFL